MSRYAWYTRVADTTHRLTVLALVGGAVYVAGGMTYQIYKNGKEFEREQTLKAAAAAGATAGQTSDQVGQQ